MPAIPGAGGEASGSGVKEHLCLMENLESAWTAQDSVLQKKNHRGNKTTDHRWGPEQDFGDNHAFIFAALGGGRQGFGLQGKCSATESHPCPKDPACQEGRSFF